MGVVVNGNIVTGTSSGVIEALAAEQDSYMDRFYSSVDEVVNCELHRLKAEEGVIPTCKAGCFQCCGQHILIGIAEAKALAHYIQREFTHPKIDALKIRTQEWHKWDESRPVRPRLSDKKPAVARVHSSLLPHACRRGMQCLHCEAHHMPQTFCEFTPSSLPTLLRSGIE